MTYKLPIKEIAIIAMIIAIDQMSKWLIMLYLPNTGFHTILNGFFDLVLVANLSLIHI